MKRKNVVFIMADDMGWGDVEAYNPKSLIPTPNINMLASEGLSFSDAHSAGALCSPTRYGIMTGRFFWRTPKKHSLVMPYDPPVIPEERFTWARMMQQSGYRTGYVGKWHLGLWYQSKRVKGKLRQYTLDEELVDFEKPIVGGPTDLGFDYFFGTAGCSTSDSPYCFIRNDRTIGIPSVMTPPEMNEQAGVISGLMAPDWDQETVDVRLADEAVGFIDRHVDETPERPFFLYYSLSAPHIPWLVPEFVKGWSKEGSRGDMNALVDWCVGQVYEALDRHGLRDDSILIFTSDNGPREGENGHQSAGPYRGYKNSPYEGGHRIPFIVRWPGKVEPNTWSNEPICLNDMMATFANHLGVDLPGTAAEDSFNILPSITGEGAIETPRAALIADSGGHVCDLGDFAIRSQRWKLIEFNKKGNPDGSPEHELYDMVDDPYETTDRSQERPDIVQEMIELLSRCKTNGLRFLSD